MTAAPSSDISLGGSKLQPVRLFSANRGLIKTFGGNLSLFASFAYHRGRRSRDTDADHRKDESSDQRDPKGPQSQDSELLQKSCELNHVGNLSLALLSSVK